MKRLILLAIILLSGCSFLTPAQDTTCVGHEDSLICKAIPSPLQADMVLRLTNLEALRTHGYTADQAMLAINRLDAIVDGSGSGAELFTAATGYLTEYAPEMFILTGFASVNIPDPLDAYSRELLHKHLERQREVARMWQATGGK